MSKHVVKIINKMSNPQKNEVETISIPVTRNETIDAEEKKQFNPYASNNTSYPKIKDHPYTYNDDFGGEMDEGFERFDLKGIKFFIYFKFLFI